MFHHILRGLSADLSEIVYQVYDGGVELVMVTVVVEQLNMVLNDAKNVAKFCVDFSQ